MAPGGGVIVPGPGGAGGVGSVPPEPQGAAGSTADCNTEPDETELSELVCKRPDWGVECMIMCGIIQNVGCPSAETHTVTKKRVQLFKCCGCKGKQQCWYVDPDDTSQVCVYRLETNTLTCGL